MVVYGTEKPQAYRPRLVDGRLQRLLSTFGVVEIRGAKWCGESWANPMLENGKESTKKLILRLAPTTVKSASPKSACASPGPHTRSR